MNAAGTVFAVLAAATLVGGAVAVGAATLFRAALGLMLSLVGVAGLFLLQRAEFLAVVQVLVYVGGVSVLIVFAIMLTERLAGREASAVHRAMVPVAVVVAGVLAAVILGVLLSANLPESSPASMGAAELGSGFLHQYLIPFEAVSLLLLVAVIGALLIAREDREP